MFSKKNHCSVESMRKERRPELDLAKAVLIFLLAFVHCTIECTTEENLASGIPYLFDTVIGGPLGAPMFMFAMGIGMVYTKNNSAQDYVIRGLRLESAGFLLNICRYTIPYFIGYAITSDYDKYMDGILYRTFCNDILQFAGMAMLLIALLQWLKVSDIVMFIISFGMSLAGMLFNGMDVGNLPGNLFLGYFIGIEDAAGKVCSDFPLFNWFMAPVFGYLFGKYLIRVKDKKKVYLMLSPICIVITIIYFAVGIKNSLGMFGEGQNCYYHILTNDILASMIAAIGILGIYNCVVRWIPKGWMYWIEDTSRNITVIYCIHWVMVVLITNVLLYAVRGTQELPLPYMLLLSFGISMAAIVISHFWAGRRRDTVLLEN